MTSKAFNPAELASNIAFLTAKKASPKVSTTPAPLQSLLKPKSQQPQAPSANIQTGISGVGLQSINKPIQPQVNFAPPVQPTTLPETGAEKVLSKDKVKEILQNAPGDRKEVIKKLMERGYKLEGLNAEEATTAENIAGGVGEAVKVAGAVATAIPLLSGIGSASQYVGKKIYQSTLNPTQQEAEAVQSFRAGTSNIKPKLASETALDLPLFTPGQGRSITSKFGGIGTRSMVGEQTEAAASNLRQTKIKPLLQKAKTTVNVQGAIKELGADIEKMAKLDPDKLEEYKQALNELVTAYDDPKYANMSLKDLQELKSGIQQRTPAKFFKGKEITDAYRELRGKLSSKLVGKLHNALKKDYGADSANLYRDYANLQGISEIGPKALTEGGRKGGFGGFIDWISSTLATPATTVSGKALYKGGGLLKIPQKLVNLGFKKMLEGGGKVTKTLIKGGKVFSLFEDGSLIPGSPTNIIAPVNPLTYKESDFIKIKGMNGLQVQKEKLKFNKSLGKKVIETDMGYIDEQGNVIN